MKLHRLRVSNFAGVREADIEFGPGLNVLYGPNDLGKSTLVDAIRLALLLPHGSTACEQYVGWTGGRDPVIELTFETERQRIWRVRKEFGNRGSSLLQESKNGLDFDDVERARKVDGRLREILRWGIPEPGGSGGSKGIPTSFLATALLSTQADVTALLDGSLENDPTASGKEQIAAALQAIAQDPLFVDLLKRTQARRDEAYTDKGARKTAKGSVFKVAAERVKETRDEKEELQRIVTDSEGTEKLLRDLVEKRQQRQEALAIATERLITLERLAVQAADREGASEQIRLAQEAVQRIRKIAMDVEEGELQAKELLLKEEEARTEIGVAQREQVEADGALKDAEEAARSEGSDPGVTDTVVRQQLELRKAAAEQSARTARQRIDVASDVQNLIDAAAEGEREHRDQITRASAAQEVVSRSAGKLKSADDELRRCDLLERALDVRLADKHVADAQAAVEKHVAIQKRLDSVLEEREVLAGQRTVMTLLKPGALAPMRRLATELAAARAALDVGFVVTVTPTKRLDLSIRKDTTGVESASSERPVEIEAATEVELGIADIATVRIRGGRRDSQDKARVLEDRWTQEVAPQIAAAGATDLDSLEAKVAEAQELDTSIQTKDTEINVLRAEIRPLEGAAEALRQASDRAQKYREALGGVALETLADELDALGVDPIAGLRRRRLDLSTKLETARASATEAEREHTIALERTANLRSASDTAISKRDVALRSFPEGLDAAVAAGHAELAVATTELKNVAADLASLDSTIAARKQRIDKAMSADRTKAETARNRVETAQRRLTATIASCAEHSGRLGELRRQRDAEDLSASERRLREATGSHAALPVPERNVTKDEVNAARDFEASMKSELDSTERDIQRAHGALEQVGGAVARERLRDATEAFELAERQEREIEADYEAWKLLLDQMKEADATQASNLGQALGPAIASRFQTLTQRRYEAVQLNAQLGTEGIVIGGAARPASRVSVGTREQLSTLYRLSLAEYLRATVVLDDQLVQSDDGRMDWFRVLFNEKAHIFQIIVFTCRPSDYLAATSIVPDGPGTHTDTDNGFIRAIDLERALKQRK